jgi:hypothetical protein
MGDDEREDAGSTGVLELFSQKALCAEIGRPDGLRQGMPAL